MPIPRDCSSLQVFAKHVPATLLQSRSILQYLLKLFAEVEVIDICTMSNYLEMVAG